MDKNPLWNVFLNMIKVFVGGRMASTVTKKKVVGTRRFLADRAES